MHVSARMVMAIFYIFLSIPCFAADFTEVGADRYFGGSSPTARGNASRDVFIAGFSVTVDGETAGDVHAAGFNVDIVGSTGEDLYAAGSSVRIGGSVQKDVSAAAASLKVTDDATIGGNARLSGGTLVLDAPVAGSLAATAGDVKINSTIGGDVRVMAGRLSFGPDAKIGGTLRYAAPSEQTIPASVIDPARVTYEKLERPTFTDEMASGIEDAIPSFWPSFLSVLFGSILMLAFLLLVAAFFLAYTPDRVKAARLRASTRPGLNLLFGIFGLAALIGLVPVSGMTLVGIPLIPIVILLIVLMWLMGYLLGVYTVSMRVREGFASEATTIAGRLLTLGLGIVALAILNFIPIIGWMINLAVLLLGIGGLTWAMGEYLARRPELKLENRIN